MPTKELPSLDFLRNTLDFDLKRGFLKHKSRKSPPIVHKSTGYVRITIKGKKYPVHRIIWALSNNILPKIEHQIDHINGIRSDNRIENLRLVTASGNSRNTEFHRFNKDKDLGLYYRKDRKKWRVGITINRKRIWLGCFNNKKDAINARKEAENRFKFYDKETIDGNFI